MLKIIVSAYACSPDKGSELGIGWNWCVELAKHCELHIITESEYQERIEAVLPTLEQGKKMHFHFLPVTEKVRQMCWNQGDWRFYHYYKKWQQQAADTARDICRKERIDILHQLTMQGFREPGYLWQVSQETGIPFIWGPIGGIKLFPMAYTKDSSWKIRIYFQIKNFISNWQLKHNKRVDNAMRQASLLISSIPESYYAIKNVKGLESVIMPDTGTENKHPNDNGNQKDKQRFTILWAAKFDFRKRLDLALKALAQAGISNLRLQIFGSGNTKQVAEAKALAEKLGITQQIEWMGNCTQQQVKTAMQQASLFLFTSVNEECSSVIMEAISNHLPILCFDCCGMSAVVSNDVGIKIPLTNPEQSVKDFAEKITYLYHHPETLATMSANCYQRAEDLSWENKARQMVELYNKSVNKNDNNVPAF